MTTSFRSSITIQEKQNARKTNLYLKASCLMVSSDSKESAVWSNRLSASDFIEQASTWGWFRQQSAGAGGEEAADEGLDLWWLTSPLDALDALGSLSVKQRCLLGSLRSKVQMSLIELCLQLGYFIAITSTWPFDHAELGSMFLVFLIPACITNLGSLT